MKYLKKKTIYFVFSGQFYVTKDIHSKIHSKYIYIKN